MPEARDVFDLRRSGQSDRRRNGTLSTPILSITTLAVRTLGDSLLPWSVT